MKKTLWSALLFLGTSFVLSGLQAAFYFFPLPLPAFWFVVLTFYSFKKEIHYSLGLNVVHMLVISAFAVTPWAPLLILMNLSSIAFKFYGERFHTSFIHLVLGSAGGYFAFQFADWVLDTQISSLAWPPVMTWIGTSLSTLLVAPPIIYGLERFNQKIDYERVDTLENLRI